MEQHPVPQQISSYEFRLVGDMTLKQFFLLAGGCVVALLFYASGLPSYFKWPLIILSSSLGTAMAFVPFEERPLQTWFFAFFKAVYSPTQFFWQKKAKIPEFLEERAVAASKVAVVASQVVADRAKLTEYLAGLPTKKSPLDQQEEGFLKQIGRLFSQSSLPTNVQVEARPLAEAQMPAGIRIRALGQIGPFERTPLSPVGEIPQPQAIPTPTYHPSWWRPPGRPKKSFSQAKQATFAPEIPMPSVPTIPNVLVGMVKDNLGKIVERAIIEIRDSAGNPVRALRTNKLGQFRIVTPLGNGVYEIETEKEGLQFEVIKITLKGEIVQPIEIRAK